jgi:hypothetical protein
MIIKRRTHGCNLGVIRVVRARHISHIFGTGWFQPALCDGILRLTACQQTADSSQVWVHSEFICTFVCLHTFPYHLHQLGRTKFQSRVPRPRLVKLDYSRTTFALLLIVLCVTDWWLFKIIKIIKN